MLKQEAWTCRIYHNTQCCSVDLHRWKAAPSFMRVTKLQRAFVRFTSCFCQRPRGSVSLTQPEDVHCYNHLHTSLELAGRSVPERWWHLRVNPSTNKTPLERKQLPAGKTHKHSFWQKQMSFRFFRMLVGLIQKKTVLMQSCQNISQQHLFGSNFAHAEFSKYLCSVLFIIIFFCPLRFVT